ncbi:hypothetical protein [Acidisphaera sp. L21]|uniref:hypothetical protein n=1 Tax=Acidisphaera sp. L21 TaxID=1641851 RepID=UPI00131B47AF|nr:hypothetical protein [Acidisphaera sp. L21]
MTTLDPAQKRGSGLSSGEDRACKEEDFYSPVRREEKRREEKRREEKSWNEIADNILLSTHNHELPMTAVPLPTSRSTSTPSTTPSPTTRRVNAAGHAYHGRKIQTATRGRYPWTPKALTPDASQCATIEQVSGAYEAMQFAASTGRRLNTWFTVIFPQLHGSSGWHAGEPAGPQVRKQRERLRTCLAGWCNRHGIPQAWISAVENVAGRGPHIHVLMHLPEAAPPKTLPTDGEIILLDPLWHQHRQKLYDLLRKFSGWSQRELDAAPEGLRPIDLSEVHLPTDHPKDNTFRKFCYLVKSLSPDEVLTYQGQRMTLGEIISHDGCGEDTTVRPSTNTYTHRMVSSSRSIAAGARENAGWKDGKFDLTILSRRIRQERLRETASRLLRNELPTRKLAETTSKSEPDPIRDAALTKLFEAIAASAGDAENRDAAAHVDELFEEYDFSDDELSDYVARHTMATDLSCDDTLAETSPRKGADGILASTAGVGASTRHMPLSDSPARRIGAVWCPMEGL